MATPLPPNLKPVKHRFSTWRAISAMIFREMSTTYGRSPGGYLWAILEPALGIFLLVLIFSVAFRAPPLGNSFALFYASGMLPFLMFNDVANKVGQAIQFSRQLLEYPRVTFIDAMAARLILNTVTQLMVHAVVLGGIFVFFTPNTVVNVMKLVEGYAFVLLLACGFGALNGFLMLAMPVWQNIWSIVMRPMFLISGIIFIFEAVPQPYSDALWFNPVIHFIGMMRDAYYPFYQPTYISPIYVATVAVLTGFSGLFLQRRYYKDMLLK